MNPWVRFIDGKLSQLLENLKISNINIKNIEDIREIIEETLEVVLVNRVDSCYLLF